MSTSRAPLAVLCSLALVLFACGRADNDPDNPGGGGGGGGSGGGGGGGGGGGNPAVCAPSCARGYQCVNRACQLDPTGLWVLTVGSGRVSERKPNGDTWDALGGAPDPFVCLTVQGQRSCTRAASDTFQPRWDDDLITATATALQAGVGVEYIDEDISNHDGICSGNLAVTEASFRSGTWGAQCSAGSFSATLVLR